MSVWVAAETEKTTIPSPQTAYGVKDVPEAFLGAAPRHPCRERKIEQGKNKYHIELLGCQSEVGDFTPAPRMAPCAQLLPTHFYAAVPAGFPSGDQGRPLGGPL